MNNTPRILVVDDDPDVVNVFSRFLKSAGYRVYESLTGLQGLQMARELRPDVVLLDVLLPDIHGVEICRQIKQDHRLQDTFVVMCSGEGANVANRVEGLEVGADEYLAKPVNMKEMLARIRGLMRLRDTIDALRASEERFHQLADNIREVFWMTDCSKHEMIYVSPAYEEIWGQTCQSLYASPRNWTNAIHPEDRKNIVEAALTKQSSGEYDVVYRIVRSNGEIRCIHDRAFPIHDDAGMVYRIVGIAEDITARRQSENELRDSEAHKSAIMRSALDAIITFDQQGLITDCNPASEKIFGEARAKLIGKDIAIVIIPPALRDWFHGGLTQFFVPDKTSCLSSRIEISALRADGTEFPIEFTITPIELEGPPVFAAFIRDITGRRVAEEKTRLFGYAIQSAQDFICITDEKNRFTFANQTFLEAHGYSEEEVLGRTPEFLYSTHNPPGLCDVVYNQTLAGGWTGDLVNRRKDGTDFPISLTTSRIKNSEGKTLGLIGVSRDITASKRNEEELRRLSLRIIEAQEAERLRVARELHDVVNQLIASAKMRLRKVEQSLAGLNPAAREILTRCGDLLVQALEENRRIAHDLRPADLDELGLEEACRNLCQNVQLRTELTVNSTIGQISHRLPPHVELHLFRMLQEALNNVEKHARTKNVQVQIAEIDGKIILKIQDDGCGFSQRASNGKSKGHGSGLTNIRERAAFLGGTCEVESSPKMGTTITVHAPLGNGHGSPCSTKVATHRSQKKQS